MPYVKNQYFDDNGIPLSGGLLYTYQGGTSTAKATYQDAGGGIAHTNPVVLDAAGRAVVFLATGAYKLVLKNAAGVTIWTQDGVSNQDLVSDVDNVADLKNLSPNISTYVHTLGRTSVNDGGGWVYYWDSASTEPDDGGMVIQPTSAPEEGRWIGLLPPDRLLNVRVYGALCNGVHDDIAELQAADAFAAAEGCVLFFDGDTLFGTNYTFQSYLKLAPAVKLLWGSFKPTLKLIDLDNTRHFNCTASYVPIMANYEYDPAWFGETVATHPVTTAAISNSTNIYSHLSYCGNFAADSDSVSIRTAGKILTGGDIGIAADTDLLELASGVLSIRGSAVVNAGANIGVVGDTDLLTLSSALLTVNGAATLTGNLLVGANIGIAADPDLMVLTTNSLSIRGNTVINAGSNIGCVGDTDLITLTADTVTVTGAVKPLQLEIVRSDPTLTGIELAKFRTTDSSNVNPQLTIKNSSSGMSLISSASSGIAGGLFLDSTGAEPYMGFKLNGTMVGLFYNTGKFGVNGDLININTAKTPASATATGSTGDICWSSGYIYVCVAANTWKRAALSTW
jgi:hypothetical protein